MEKRIKEYEKFIKKELDGELSADKKKRLAQYHHEMMESFQHERLIHLIVTLFFAFLATAVLFIAAWMTTTYSLSAGMWPLYVMAILIVVLTGFYIKHYYFLENHIQGLYEYTKKILEI